MSHLIWGLTGPTGAGKGTVCGILRGYGFTPVDTDALAREATAPGSPVLGKLCEAFGRDILLADGALNRPLLARRAFSDERARLTLNAAVHPAVIERVKEAVAGEGRYVIDAPLLFESGLDALCARTLAVLCGETVRLARIMARDGIDESAARLRLSAQPDERFYAERAAWTVRNEGDIGQLAENIAGILRREGLA